MPESNQKLIKLLAGISRGNSSYSKAAGAVLQSVSADNRTPIELPESIKSILGEGGLPELVAYDQNDLLHIIDILATSIGTNLKAAEQDTDEDSDDLVGLVQDYRDIYKMRTNEDLLSYDTSDIFRRLSSAKAYALAAALIDIAVDRKLKPSPLWQTIIDNNGKLGGV